MNFLSDAAKPYGHLDYLPNPTQGFLAVLPKLYNTDIRIYFTLAANIIDFINFKTIRITPKEISEKLPDKSRPSIRNIKEQEKRQEELAKRADTLLEKKAEKLGEAWTDEHGYPRNFHVNRLKKEVIEELNLDFDPWDFDNDSPS